MSPAEVEAKLLEASRRAQEIGLSTKPRPIDKPIVEEPKPVWMFTPAAESVDELEARERQRVEARVAKLLNSAHVPRRYAEATLDNLERLPERTRFPYASAVDALRSMARGGAVIGVAGPRGPGKTHMCCALILEHCRNLISARYCTAMDFFLAIKREYAKRDGDELQAERQFLEPSLLVIDEIQVRGETPWEDVRLTNLIDKRYADLKTTVIITNVTREELTQKIGDSIADRFFDGGGVIECRWPSLRGRLEGGDDAA